MLIADSQPLLVIYCFRCGKHEEALKILDKSVEVDPTYSEAYTLKHLIHDNQHNYAEALKAIDKAIELNPNDPVAWTDKGALLAKNGNKEDAIECFKEAVHIVRSCKLITSWCVTLLER